MQQLIEVGQAGVAVNEGVDWLNAALHAVAGQLGFAQQTTKSAQQESVQDCRPSSALALGFQLAKAQGQDQK